MRQVRAASSLNSTGNGGVLVGLAAYAFGKPRVASLSTIMVGLTPEKTSMQPKRQGHDGSNLPDLESGVLANELNTARRKKKRSNRAGEIRLPDSELMANASRGWLGPQFQWNLAWLWVLYPL